MTTYDVNIFKISMKQEVSIVLSYVLVVDLPSLDDRLVIENVWLCTLIVFLGLEEKEYAHHSCFKLSGSTSRFKVDAGDEPVDIALLDLLQRAMRQLC